jgi:hypothetical protein
MSKKKMLDFAVQQFTGYGAASKGYGICGLIESMGLTAEEYAAIREDVKISLSKGDFAEVEEYFEERKQK